MALLAAIIWDQRTWQGCSELRHATAPVAEVVGSGDSRWVSSFARNPYASDRRNNDGSWAKRLMSSAPKGPVGTASAPTEFRHASVAARGERHV